MVCATRSIVSVAAVLLLLVAAGCSDNSTGDMFKEDDGGNVQLVVTTDAALGAVAAAVARHGNGTGAGSDEGSDDPGDGDGTGTVITGAAVRISDIKARSTTLQELVDVAVTLPIDIDLLGMSGDGSVELPVGTLPPDTYDQIVVVISALIVTAEDGTRITIEPPGGGWTTEVPTEPFEVVDGEVTTIMLEFGEASFRFDFDANLGDIGAGDFDPQFNVVIGG